MIRYKKHIILYCVTILILTLNVLMIRNLFFSDSVRGESYRKLKETVIPNDAEIMKYAKTVFNVEDSIVINTEIFNSNKKEVIFKNNILGYAYIVIDTIRCSTCSNVDLLLFVDKNYNIINITFLRDVIESLKIVPLADLEIYTANFINKNLLKDDFNTIVQNKKFSRHATTMKKDILKIQMLLKLENWYIKNE